MMNWLKKLRVRSQLMLLMGLATGIALTIAGAVVALSDYRSGREALLQRLTIQAAITARSSAAALAFDDVDAAMKTLEGLKADRAILEVTLERLDGTVFAQHTFAADGARRAKMVEVTADVRLPQRIGSLQLRATTAELNAALDRQILILSVMMVATLLLTLAASAWLQRLVSAPIVALAAAAASVAASRDFGLRVTVAGSKELHDLVLAFNQMLADLKSGADELASHQEKLELEVSARTAELASALKVAQQAALAKAEFLANMSHEIRTPMNGVIGMMDLLYDEKLPAESKSMLDIARNSADSMLTLINDILDFSKIDAGKLSLENVEFELRPLAEEVASLYTQKAHEKGVELICAIHNDVPQFLCGDPTRLRQIMSNLMGNAVKFTEKGEVLLAVRFRVKPDADHGMLRVVVRDTGIGMTKATLRTLFTAFTQADSSTTRKYGGTGLGLAICKRVADAMGGFFRVKSTPGRGTVFSVHVPLKRAAAGIAASPRQLAGLKCLIVDDNATNRRVLEHYLEREAITYRSESSPFAGLDAVRRAAAEGVPYDLVLLDYQMPEMDGIGFVRQLEKEPGIAATKCIILSSLGARVPEAHDLNIAAWLSKPVRIAHLQRIVSQVTGRREQSVATVVSGAALVTFDPRSRVLLVEDNLVNQMVGKRIFKTLGLTVDVAENGALALAAIKREHFDLVLMDCQMPVMDGYAATTAVRAWEAAAVPGSKPRIPIVAMTANALSGDREKCLAAGMDEYLSKPIKRDALVPILARWLPVMTAAAAAPRS